MSSCLFRLVFGVINDIFLVAVSGHWLWLAAGTHSPDPDQYEAFMLCFVVENLIKFRFIKVVSRIVVISNENI